MAKKRGMVLETMLDLTHQYYRNQGLADINKKETKTIFDKKSREMRYVKKEGFDFEGCVNGGMSVAIEAKEAQTKLHIDTRNKSGLKMHQLEALLFRGKLGGLAGVIWMPDPRSAYLLDYSFLKNFYENIYNKPGKTKRPVKSIMLDFVRENAPNVMRSGGLIDYLEYMNA